MSPDLFIPIVTGELYLLRISGFLPVKVNMIISPNYFIGLLSDRLRYINTGIFSFFDEKKAVICTLWSTLSVSLLFQFHIN